MPYVKQEIRSLVDQEIHNLEKKLATINEDQRDGSMNYTITRLVDYFYGMGGYAVFNRAMGIIDCVGREFYRRRVAPYEDKTKNRNGDVYYL